MYYGSLYHQQRGVSPIYQEWLSPFNFLSVGLDDIFIYFNLAENEQGYNSNNDYLSQ